MVTSFVSIFRYKSEMAQGSALTAGEGFVLLPVSVILCLGPCRQSLTTDVSAPKYHVFASARVPCVFCRWIHHGRRHILVLGVLPSTLLMQECLSLPSLISLRGGW